jgi:hypothetical protein
LLIDCCVDGHISTLIATEQDAAMDLDARYLRRGYALRRIFSPKREELREGWIIVCFFCV